MEGDLTVAHSILRGNTALFGGGGMLNADTAALSDVVFTGIPPAIVAVVVL